MDVLRGGDARRALLMLGVMSLHSLTEGVGIGVSYGGRRGWENGGYVATALALHNVPEGLAVCLVLVPKGTPLLDAALWAVLTSVPQPLAALPSLWLVSHLPLLLPLGLGFAAGAMLYVAATELAPEAVDKIGPARALATALAAGALLALLGAVMR